MPQEASRHTVAANARVRAELPFDDTTDFEDAQRGFVGTYEDLVVQVPGAPAPAWDLTAYGFLDADEPPDTVNPSLWRIARLNLFNGLFEVTEGVYQVRGFDLSNVTLVEGETGVIVIDPLISPAVAAKALELYRAHRGDRPVVAVIYTHSHIDHYGGVKGIVSQEDVDAGRVQVIAPEGFLEEAVSENVYAGNAMARRAFFQYGPLLERGPRGGIDAGLGKSTSLGQSTLIPPTDLVRETGERRTVDGVEMEFYMAPGTEAPSEFLVWFPQHRVLDTAEDVTHTLHNLYTLRGAQVRDARTWWKVLNDVLQRYGQDVEVVIAQHHWPVWGRERAVALIEDQRDMIKYLHDQSLHLANSGLTMTEVAETIALPDAIGRRWHNRGYYGSVNHNAKGVVQRYLGWYDSNPSHLWQLPPEDAATRYVEYMGGADAIVARAREAYDAGDYRWVAEVVNHVVFADPSHRAARELVADALEQLGYQQENPTWRNEFLYGAHELRHGAPAISLLGVASPDVVASMSPDMLLDYLGIRLDGPKAAAAEPVTVRWEHDGTHHLLELQRGVLLYTEGKQAPADAVHATLHAAKDVVAALVMGATTLDDAVASGDLTVDGDTGAVRGLLDLLVTFDEMFPVVEP